MKQYRNILKKILAEGETELNERTGAGTIKINGHSEEWDLAESFPAPDIRPIAWKGVLGETLTFLHGDINITDFLRRDCKFWTPDAMRHNYDQILASGLMTAEEITSAQTQANEAKAIMLEQNTPFAEKCERAKPLLQPAFQLQKKYEEYAVQSPSFAEAAGSLGPVYGAVWRGKNGGGTVDQIAAIEADLRNGGKSRRNICTAFKPELLPEQALPPCHYDFQVLTRPQSNKLDVIMNQRSADSVLGVIHNIPQYGIITQLLAETHGFELGKLRINFGDLHIYLPHVPLVEEELLKREEKPNNTRLVIKNRKDSITEYEPEDFEPIKETGYAPHPALTYRIPMFGGLF